MSSTRLPAVVVILVALFGGVLAWRIGAASETGSPGAGNQAAGPVDPTMAGGEAGEVGYVVSREGTLLSSDSAGSEQTIAAGVVLPVTAETDGMFEVFDTCNRTGWVGADDVEVGLVPRERGRQMDRAVFVIDAGHGFPDLGAVGPSGLTEAEVNVDVSGRIIALLGSPHDIDWATGAVTAGSAIPAAAAAIPTRSPEGPNGGDYELGLTFRATLANSVHATALVSIHHNTEPTRDLDHPGSSAFVSLENTESPRLGGLIVDELRTALSRFEADWVGSQGDGLSARVGGDGTDYYSILARAEVPAAIIEGAYISNPSEEALIMTDEFRQEYAEAVYRALVRYVTSDDDPIPAPEPELFDVEPPPRSMDDCVVPTP